MNSAEIVAMNALSKIALAHCAGPTIVAAVERAVLDRPMGSRPSCARRVTSERAERRARTGTSVASECARSVVRRTV